MVGRLRLRPGGRGFLSSDDFAGATFAFDFGAGGSAKGVSSDGQFAGQFAIAKNFDSKAEARAISQAGAAQGGGIDTRSVFKAVERVQIHRQIARSMAGIVKAALGNSPDQRHLAPFEADANGTTRAGCLAFAS